MVKIEWAPRNIPPQRRMQTLTVGFYMFLMLGIGLCSHIFYILLLIFGNIYLKAVLIVYGIWIYFDKERAENENSGSGVRWMRDNFFWKHFRDYFPVELVKTAELPPNKNYLVACYPHGIGGIGTFTNMCVDICKWNELFPKIRPKAGTLAFQFSTPFWRHLVPTWGLISVTKKSLLNNLTTSVDPNDPINSDGYTASAVAVVVGGANEALDARPGKYILTIKNRKGFIKLAMKSGAAIVPSFSFGEVDVFDQLDNPPNSIVRKVQILVKKITGIAPIFLLGRGISNIILDGCHKEDELFKLVIGAPMEVPKVDNPNEEEVGKLHQRFMDELNILFETYKAKYIENSENIHLEMK